MRESLAARSLMARQAGARASRRCVRASLRGARRRQPARWRAWSGAELAAAHLLMTSTVVARSVSSGWSWPYGGSGRPPCVGRPALDPLMVAAAGCARSAGARARWPGASRCGSVAIAVRLSPQMIVLAARAAEPAMPPRPWTGRASPARPARGLTAPPTVRRGRCQSAALHGCARLESGALRGCVRRRHAKERGTAGGCDFGRPRQSERGTLQTSCKRPPSLWTTTWRRRTGQVRAAGPPSPPAGG
jgi:hypothetical protein